MKLKLLPKSKFIYLISPAQNIGNIFFKNLELIFKTNKVAFFQLRLKKGSFKYKLNIGKKIKKISRKFKVKFIINDEPMLAKKLNADGCHLGQMDMDINKAKKILKGKIIGITCHNSKKLINKAIINKADYIALGSFFSSKTKKVKYKANIKTLLYAKKLTKIPIVAIGGIKDTNYKKLLLNKVNFLAISGYIWNNKKLSPVEAIRKLK